MKPYLLIRTHDYKLLADIDFNKLMEDIIMHEKENKKLRELYYIKQGYWQQPILVTWKVNKASYTLFISKDNRDNE